ncbi:MAG: hypothetical protein V4489_07960 [Chlamydiota bacterium]
MTDVRQVKKELLQECEKFISLFKDNPRMDPSSIGSVLGMNRSIFQKLQEVLLLGDEADKKEARAVFSQVVGVFGFMSKGVADDLGLSSDLIGQTVRSEDVEMMRNLGKDLENLARKSM